MKQITICFSRTIERKNFLNLKNSHTFPKVNSFFDKAKLLATRPSENRHAEKLNFENPDVHATNPSFRTEKNHNSTNRIVPLFTPTLPKNRIH
uniref:Uncharacterized protein n=1 Tax=Leptospira santarosai serovar Arenal str. MAVJ 401 TaxID=1049976 RepID=M6JH65_9LEPT|nr:hypothetical protein LEP1GSC063_4378 [Leptospira santarosai serovar Arenal str. MAVJ 401]